MAAMKMFLLVLVLTTVSAAVTKAQVVDQSDPKENTIPQGDEPDTPVVANNATLSDNTTVVDTTVAPTQAPAPANTTTNTTTTARPPSGTSTLSRIINDILQIPISVLRAVNTMLTNAFNQKN